MAKTRIFCHMLTGFALVSAGLLCACDVQQPVEASPSSLLPYEHALFAGKILDGRTQEGIPNVRVEVSGIGAATTGADGSYRFPNLTSLPNVLAVTLRAQAPGYAPAAVTVNLKQKPLLVPTLRLHPSDHPETGEVAHVWHHGGARWSNVYDSEFPTELRSELISESVSECMAGPRYVYTIEKDYTLNLTGDFLNPDYDEQWVLAYHSVWDGTFSSTSEIFGYIPGGQHARLVFRDWYVYYEGWAYAATYDVTVYPSVRIASEMAAFEIRWPAWEHALIPCYV